DLSRIDVAIRIGAGRSVLTACAEPDRIEAVHLTRAALEVAFREEPGVHVIEILAGEVGFHELDRFSVVRLAGGRSVRARKRGKKIVERSVFLDDEDDVLD